MDEAITPAKGTPPSRAPRYAVSMLVAQALLLFLYMLFAGGLTVVAPQEDSTEYILLSEAPLADIIRGYRTPAYPLLIHAVHAVGLSVSALPYIHLGLHFFAALVLYIGLYRYGGGAGVAFGITSGFLYTVLNDNGPAHVLTDVPARTLAVLAVGLLFWLVTKPRCMFLWSGLALTIFMTYMTRPAYVVLVGMIPLCGVLFYFLRLPDRAKGERPPSPRQGWRFGVLLLLISLPPLLMYCGYRRAAVGHFGITSSAGYCLMGITAQLLEPSVIEDELPVEWQPIAHKIAAARKKAGISGLYSKSRGYSSRIDWEGWLDNFWGNLKVSENTMAEYYQIKPKEKYDLMPALLDSQMGGLGVAIIKAKPEMYMLYVMFSARRALGILFERARVAQAMLGLLLIAFILRTFLSGWRSFPAQPPQDPAGRRIFPPLIITAILFPLFTITPILLIVIPMDRYLYASGVFFPPLLGLFCWQEICAWQFGWRQRVQNVEA